MYTAHTSNEEAQEPAAGKKPYKTLALRRKSVFVVPAMARGKITSAQNFAISSRKLPENSLNMITK